MEAAGEARSGVVVREEARLSERRACGLIGMHRGSWRYRRKERNEAALRARLRESAGERPRFGYRRLYIFLRREKTADGTLRWRVNHKRVYRLYREEGLAMQRRKRRKFRSEARLPRALPTRANEMWTMDYTHDEMAGGAEIRTLNLMDGFTRQALWIELDMSLPGLRVVRVLEGLRERRGTPAAIQVDNGTEFTSRVVDQWAYQNQVALHFIERGKPTQNAFIESFNGKFRDECLNQTGSWISDTTCSDRGLAGGLQHGTPTQLTKISDTGRVRGKCGRATGVSPHAGRYRLTQHG